MLIHVYQCRRMFFLGGGRVAWRQFVRALKRRFLFITHPDKIAQQEPRDAELLTEASREMQYESEALLREAEDNGIADDVVPSGPDPYPMSRTTNDPATAWSLRGRVKPAQSI